MGVNPYRKAALFLIRLVALALIFISLLFMGGYAMSWMLQRPVNAKWSLVLLETLPFIVGFLLLFKASAIARRLTEDLDDE
jgi:hypothetical protein